MNKLVRELERILTEIIYNNSIFYNELEYEIYWGLIRDEIFSIKIEIQLVYGIWLMKKVIMIFFGFGDFIFY